jgi:polyisoprenoid-binding protein YceI
MRFVSLAIVLLSAPPALASDWTLDTSASAVRIETTAFGRPVIGIFSEFDATIALDPDNLSEARIDGQVSVASGDTENPQYNSEMKGSRGLDADNYPLARFISMSIAPGEACEDGSGLCLQAEGLLTLAGNEQPATLNFRLNIEGERAITDGTLTVDRDDYGIGSNTWGDAAETILVRLHIEATR